MAFHHVAITTRDLEASNRFYTEAMGFELVKVDVIPFLEGGWARHLFYDTGNGELIALWDLHYDDLGDFDPAISTGLGLPNFVNHIAFGASDLDDIDARKDRLLANGLDATLERDHVLPACALVSGQPDITGDDPMPRRLDREQAIEQRV